uniref:SH2 domain-containing protein n=1 Tax=Macrostomum lignano TaxID=282301 RepID=A0A1I8F5M1_9PLAT
MMFKNERWNCTFQHQFLNTGQFRVGHHSQQGGREKLVMAAAVAASRAWSAGACLQPACGSARWQRPRRQSSRRAVQLTSPLSLSRSARELRSLDRADDRARSTAKPAIPTCRRDNLSLASGGSANFFGDNRRAAIEQPGSGSCLTFITEESGTWRCQEEPDADLQLPGAISGSARSDSASARPDTAAPATSRDANLHDLFQRSVFVVGRADTLPQSSRSGSRRRREVGVAGSSGCLNFDPAGAPAAATECKKRLLAYSRSSRRTSASRGWTTKTEFHGVSRGAPAPTTVWPRTSGLLRPPVLAAWNRFERRLYAAATRAWCNCSMLLYNPIQGALRGRCVKVKEMQQGAVGLILVSRGNAVHVMQSRKVLTFDKFVKAASGLLCRNHSEGFLFSNLAAQRQHAKPTSVNCKSVKAGGGSVACFELARRQGSDP